MSFVKISVCPQCGAPIYVPGVWHGVVPPTPTYSCPCFASKNTWNNEPTPFSNSEHTGDGTTIRWHYEDTPTIDPNSLQNGPSGQDAIDQLEKAFEEEEDFVQPDTLFTKVSRLEKSVEELKDLLKQSLVGDTKKVKKLMKKKVLND